MESNGAIRLGSGAVISAESPNTDADILCYGTVADYGATINGEMKVLGQLYRENEK